MDGRVPVIPIFVLVGVVVVVLVCILALLLLRSPCRCCSLGMQRLQLRGGGLAGFASAAGAHDFGWCGGFGLVEEEVLPEGGGVGGDVEGWGGAVV